MADLGLPPPPKAAHGCLLTLLLPMQVEIPWTKQRSESDGMRTRRAAWFESLAALMASQPASYLNMNFSSAALPAAQALAPWITSLSVTVDPDEDIGKILKGAIKVGRQRSLTWGALPVS
jgi:hypothetical protein